MVVFFRSVFRCFLVFVGPHLLGNVFNNLSKIELQCFSVEIIVFLKLFAEVM